MSELPTKQVKADKVIYLRKVRATELFSEQWPIIQGAPRDFEEYYEVDLGEMTVGDFRNKWQELIQMTQPPLIVAIHMPRYVQTKPVGREVFNLAKAEASYEVIAELREGIQLARDIAKARNNDLQVPVYLIVHLGYVSLDKIGVFPQAEELERILAFAVHSVSGVLREEEVNQDDEIRICIETDDMFGAELFPRMRLVQGIENLRYITEALPNCYLALNIEHLFRYCLRWPFVNEFKDRFRGIQINPQAEYPGHPPQDSNPQLLSVLEEIDREIVTHYQIYPYHRDNFMSTAVQEIFGNNKLAQRVLYICVNGTNWDDDYYCRSDSNQFSCGAHLPTASKFDQTPHEIWLKGFLESSSGCRVISLGGCESQQEGRGDRDDFEKGCRHLQEVMDSVIKGFSSRRSPIIAKGDKLPEIIVQGKRIKFARKINDYDILDLDLQNDPFGIYELDSSCARSCLGLSLDERRKLNCYERAKCRRIKRAWDKIEDNASKICAFHLPRKVTAETRKDDPTFTYDFNLCDPKYGHYGTRDLANIISFTKKIGGGKIMVHIGWVALPDDDEWERGLVVAKDHILAAFSQSPPENKVQVCIETDDMFGEEILPRARLTRGVDRIRRILKELPDCYLCLDVEHFSRCAIRQPYLDICRSRFAKGEDPDPNEREKIAEVDREILKDYHEKPERIKEFIGGEFRDLLSDPLIAGRLVHMHVCGTDWLNDYYFSPKDPKERNPGAHLPLVNRPLSHGKLEIVNRTPFNVIFQQILASNSGVTDMVIEFDNRKESLQAQALKSIESREFLMKAKDDAIEELLTS